MPGVFVTEKMKDNDSNYWQQRLTCWPWPENLDSNNLKPSGYVMVNPNEEEAPFIEIKMTEFTATIQYPTHAEVGKERSSDRQYML